MLAYPPFSFGRTDEAPLVEWQEHYRLHDEKINGALGAALLPEVADLVDVAVAVYVTDRLRRRRPKRARNDGRHWERRLPVRVALRHPEVWREPATRVLLHDLLHWLTDDTWEIEVLDGGPRLPRPSDSQPTLFEQPLVAPAQVGLLSGGLDSLLGAAADTDHDGELLLVSTTTQNHLGARQAKLAAGLSRVGRRRVRHLQVPVNLTAAGKSLGEGEEGSQRSRAFVFLTLGAAAAITGHCGELRVYENGPGALNLALSPGQRGAMNTRAMRPETLAQMSQLITAVTGKPFLIVNPNMWLTKAQMVAAAPRALDELIAHARSCDGAHAARRANDAPCGACTSCVLRRQALIAGGRSHLDRLDVAMMTGDSLRASTPGVLDPSLRLMLQQVFEIDRCLQTPDPWGPLVHRWPELLSARESLGVKPERLIELLRTYRNEWRRVPSPAAARLLAA